MAGIIDLRHQGPDPLQLLIQQMMQEKQLKMEKERLGLQKQQMQIQQERDQRDAQAAANQQQSAINSFMQAWQDPNVRQALGPQMEQAYGSMHNANVPMQQGFAEVNALAMPGGTVANPTPSPVDAVRQRMARESALGDAVDKIRKLNLPSAVREDSINRMGIINSYIAANGKEPDPAILRQIAPLEADVISTATAKENLKKMQQEGTANEAAMQILKVKFPVLASMPKEGWGKAADTLLDILDKEESAQIAIYRARQEHEINGQPTYKDGMDLFERVFLAQLNDTLPPTVEQSDQGLKGDPVGVRQAFNVAMETLRSVDYLNKIPGLEKALTSGSAQQLRFEDGYTQSVRFKTWLSQNSGYSFAQLKSSLVDAGWTPQEAVRMLNKSKKYNEGAQ